MIALGLCLGVLVISTNDGDQTIRHGKLVSIKDLSVEFSSSGRADETDRSTDAADGLDFITALNLISRFIGTADSFQAEGFGSADEISVWSNLASFKGITDSVACDRTFDCRTSLSKKISANGFARASI